MDHTTRAGAPAGSDPAVDGAEVGDLGRAADLVRAGDGMVELGAFTDAQLAALAPASLSLEGWWRAAPDEGDATGAGPAVGGRRLPVAVGGPVDSSGGTGGAVRHPGAVRVVRQVLHRARGVVTWQHGPRRGAFVVADGVVLVDRIADGHHELLLADQAVATAILAIGLDPFDVARHVSGPPSPARRVPRRLIEQSVPPPETRRSVVTLVRVGVGPPPREVVLTVIGTADGLQAWRALPDGDVATAPLDRDGVVAAAVALLGDEPVAVPA